MISSEEYKILKSFAERIPDNDPGAHNNLAVVYYNKGLYDDAISELEKALQIDPNFVLARNNMDLILKKSGRLEDKAKELGRIIDTEPFDEHSTLELADTYRKLNRFSQAIIFYKKILDYNPGSYEAHFGLGITLRSLGKYDDALEEIKRSLEIKISPEGYRALGEVYFNKGVIDLAIKSFQESILLDSSSAEGHFLLGFALGEKGKLKEGLEEIHRAIAINPALAQFEPNLPIDLKEHKGQWDFLKEQLGIPKASVNEYQAHFNLGITYLNKGLFSESKREFDECFKVRNDHAELLTALGEIEIFLNRLPEARKHLDRSLEIDFSSARSTNDMGIVFLKSNDYANAEVWFNKALGIEHNYPSAINNIAVVELSQNKIEQAITRLQQAVKLGSQEARYNLGMYYLRKGDYEHALKTFNGSTADDLFARGLIYSETGRDEESIAAFKGALDISPNHAGVYYNMGFVLMKVGRYDEGLSYIRKGMEIEPNFEKEKYRLAVIPELYEFGPYYTIAQAKETAEAKEELPDFFPSVEPEPKTEDFMSMAENAVRRNELDNALAMVEEAVKRSPESNQPVIMKARILFQSDNFDDALDVLGAYGAKHPEDTEVRQVTAELLKSVGQLEEARQHYEALAEKQPQKTEWLSELASLNYALGAYDRALEIYNRLFTLDGKNVQTHLGLLKIHLKNNSKDKSLPHVQFLEQHHPDLYEANVYTGIYWLDNGDRQKAKKSLEKAIELDHSKPLPYYHLGLVEVQHGDFANACDHWKKALLLSPDDDLSEKITHCLNITMEMLEFLKKEIR
jgi:tetratricopeptide (TPR) repeat protein